jgi:hypothetical protein
MARLIVALCIFIGGSIALPLLADRMNQPTWVLVLVAVVSFSVAAGVGFWSKWKRAWSAFWFDEYSPSWGESMTPVVGKTFTNEQVELDGKQFSRCHFINVGFVFQGKAIFSFLEPKFTGSLTLRSTSHAVNMWEELRQSLDSVPGFGKPQVLTRHKETGALSAAPVPQRVSLTDSPKAPLVSALIRQADKVSAKRSKESAKAWSAFAAECIRDLYGEAAAQRFMSDDGIQRTTPTDEVSASMTNRVLRLHELLIRDVIPNRDVEKWIKRIQDREE